MLLDDRAVMGQEAARALWVWSWGVGLSALLGVLRQATIWFVFVAPTDDAFEPYPYLFRGLSALGVIAGVLGALGAWRYARAVAPSSGLQGASLVFGLDAAYEAGYLFLGLTSGGFGTSETLSDLLFYGGPILAFLRVGVLVLFFIRMARLSESLGSPIAPARVWAAIGAIGVWGLRIAASVFEWLPAGAVGLALIALLSVAVGATTLAVFLPHRAHLKATPSTASIESEPAANGPGTGMGAAGRGLGMYHGALISQLSWLVIGTALTFAVTKTGDMEGAKSMMGLVPIVALVIQCFALGGLLRFSSHLPPLHPAKGAAGGAVAALGLNLLISLVTVGLVLRALQSGRLSHLFDLRDQLPVLEGIGAVIGCVAAVALLSALERLGASAGALKLAIPVLGGFVLLFKVLDPRDLGGPLLLAFAVSLLIATIAIAGQFLGVVRRTADAMKMGSLGE